MGREKGCPYILRGFLTMDERFFKENLTSSEQEEQKVRADIEQQRVLAKETDAQEYSEVLSEIQAQVEVEVQNPLDTSGKLIPTFSNQVQVLKPIDLGTEETVNDSSFWREITQRRIKQLKRAA